MRRIRLTRQRLYCLLFLLLVVYGALFATALRERDGNFYAESRAPIGPDFDVFFAAGRLVADGEGEKIYEPERQETEQVRALGGVPEFFIHFFHPAWMAAPYAAVARFPYLTAYLIVQLALASLLIPTVLLLRGVSETVRTNTLVVGLALLAFWPTFWGLIHGQSAVFWLLCLTGVYVALRRDQDLVAGFWLGLLVGKPQLAALLVIALASQRRWRSIGTAVVVGAGLSLAGVLLAGPGWPLRFLAAATGDVYNEEVDSTGYLQMAVPGVVARLLGAASPWTIAATVVLGLTGIGTVWFLWRNARPGSASFPLLFGLTVAVTLATNPHALFYDAPLLVLPVLALIDHWRAAAPAAVWTGRRRWLVAGLFLAGYGWHLWPVTVVQPLALLPLAVGACVAWVLLHPAKRQSVPLRRDGEPALSMDSRVAA